MAVLKKAAERFVHPRPVIEADAVVTGVDRVVELDQRVGVGNSSLPERLPGDAAEENDSVGRSGVELADAVEHSRIGPVGLHQDGLQVVPVRRALQLPGEVREIRRADILNDDADHPAPAGDQTPGGAVRPVVQFRRRQKDTFPRRRRRFREIAVQYRGNRLVGNARQFCHFFDRCHDSIIPTLRYWNSGTFYLPASVIIDHFDRKSKPKFIFYR